MSDASYWSIVKAQFRKQRAAVWALRILGVLLLFATYAPVIALDVPFYASGHGFPWFGALFNPNVFPNEVDVFFNLLMATLPVLVFIWFLPRKAKWILLWGVLHMTGFLVLVSVQEDMRAPVAEFAADDGFFPPVRHHPSGRQSEYSLTPPFQSGAGEDAPYFLLGSDNLGNDVFTRLLYGSRISLTIGILAVSIYVVVGVVLGGLAGYFGGWIDDLLLFFAQVVMTIPALFLILFVLSVVETRSIYHIMLVIAALSWPQVMRLVRGEFLRQRELD